MWYGQYYVTEHSFYNNIDNNSDGDGKHNITINMMVIIRGHKHFLQLAYSKRSILREREKMHTTEHDAKHSDS